MLQLNGWRQVELPQQFIEPVCKDCDPCLRLIAEVLKLAIDDLYLPARHVNQSIYWFLSPSFEPMSFLWICFHMNLIPELVIRRHATRIRKILNEI